MNEANLNTESVIEKTNRLILASGIIVVLSAVVVAILLMLASNNTKSRTQVKNETDAIRQATEANTELISYLETNQEAITTLQDTLPTEVTILDFIQIVEGTIREFDPAGTIKFSSTNPLRVANELSIPLIITIDATPSELADFLVRFERLPYLLEMTSLEIELPQGIGSKGRVTMGGRLYVQDPFVQ